MPAITTKLIPMPVNDLTRIVRTLPENVRRLLETGTWVLVGGYCRDTIMRETASDIDLMPLYDLLCPIYAAIEAAEKILNVGQPEYTTTNAHTYASTPGHPRVQLVTRWCYRSLSESLDMLDFTMAQAGVGVDVKHQAWYGFVAETFYQDCATKRLKYTDPQREEEPGGSFLRVLKFAARGWKIHPEDLGKIISRVVAGGTSPAEITTTLYEVDPAGPEDEGRLRIVREDPNLGDGQASAKTILWNQF